ncbi:MAG: haloacid dehalogenase type II [Motiliproteus sp.]|nr:haloacid dehalogenase type II [Motiliproteus sp.]
MKPKVFAFDVYGTLVNPLQMSERLVELVGDVAPTLTQLWRDKQLEYSFRRGLMGAYEDFSVCTRQALQYAQTVVGVSLTEEQQDQSMAGYQQLVPYADVIPALKQLQDQLIEAVAFSNGSREAVTDLLTYSRVLPLLKQVVSVDAVSSFKPDPKVYGYLCQSMGQNPRDVCLVSSNPFDVIGAKNQGLQAVWVRRSAQQVFDPWGIEPDLEVADLAELVAQLN